MDQEKRKTVLYRIPLILTAAILTPNLLLSSNADAFDLKYSPYETPNKEQLQRLLENNNFPHEFNFIYNIPKNKDAKGKSLEGKFEIIKSISSIELGIKTIHPSNSKQIHFSEITQEGKILYSEKMFNTEKQTLEYNNCFFLENGQITPVSLIEKILLQNGNLKQSNFIFQGRGEFPKEYKLKSKIVNNQNNCFMLEGDIENNSPRITKVRVFYKRVRELNIPVEIWVDYKVKIMNFGLFGSNYDVHTVKGVLEI